jgi:hypothetical protein
VEQPEIYQLNDTLIYIRVFLNQIGFQEKLPGLFEPNTDVDLRHERSDDDSNWDPVKFF